MTEHTDQEHDQGDAPGHAWFHLDQVDGCAVIHAGGEIDSRTAHAFNEVVGEAGSQASHVVIDLERVTFVDSSGLGALIVARKTARESGGSISLVSPPPVVRRLLGSTQLHDVFEIHDSVAEATRPHAGWDR